MLETWHEKGTNVLEFIENYWLTIRVRLFVVWGFIFAFWDLHVAPGVTIELW